MRKCENVRNVKMGKWGNVRMGKCENERMRKFGN